MFKTSFRNSVPAVEIFALLIAMAPLTADAALSWIRVSDDGGHFVEDDGQTRFVAWGVNYDHNAAGELIEDYWEDDWPSVEEDFGEMKALGVNVVRIHLQVGRFMKTAREPNERQLQHLARLAALAEATGLYLDVTGLGCYHKEDTPEWYDDLNESDRWDVQARFWEAVARRCADSPAIFCYDLMNEPVLPGRGKAETDWLTGELGGKYFVQRISLDLAGRTREQVARAWVDRMTAAIRRHDPRRLVTVGVIPWAHVFPKAKPLFHSEKVGANLDFVSVHFYPKKGEVEEALKALAVYEIGKPLVVEEMFPLKCSLDEMDDFIRRSSKFVDGWVSFYWGRTIGEYREAEPSLAGAITAKWLERFKKLGPEMRDLK